MKDIFRAIRSTSQISIGALVGYTILSILSGLAGFAFIALVNQLIAQAIKGGVPTDDPTYLGMFAGLIAVFFISRRWLAGGIIKLSQRIYWNTRMEVIRLLIRAPYRDVKRQKAEVFSTLTQDVGNITQASILVIDFITSVVLIVACLVYMAFISLSLFGISALAILLGIGLYQVMANASTRRFNRARDLEGNFMDAFNSVLRGAKEIQMAPSKGRSIYKNKIVPVSNDAFDNNKKAYIGFLNSQLIGQLLFYALITFILLYAGAWLGTSTTVSIGFVFVLLYILGPIGTVMMVIPVMSRALISVQRMQALRTNLESKVKPEAESKLPSQEAFQNLSYEDYGFSYGPGQFEVGPIEFSIDKGQVVFIYGGNGSGKTTFMNALISLYAPTSGGVRLNGEALDPKEVEAFRSLFSVVFGDFYLFDEFYGFEDFDKEKASAYLKIFEIEDKVEMEEKGFSSIDLSTGQRKRLALIAALLEERPILVLDEWAADQDPHFRKRFYTEIIPMLKAEGRTILAITHDDAYYHCADELYRMEYGKLVRQQELQLGQPVLD